MKLLAPHLFANFGWDAKKISRASCAVKILSAPPHSKSCRRPCKGFQYFSGEVERRGKMIFKSNNDSGFAFPNIDCIVVTRVFGLDVGR